MTHTAPCTGTAGSRNFIFYPQPLGALPSPALCFASWVGGPLIPGEWKVPMEFSLLLWGLLTFTGR